VHSLFTSSSSKRALSLAVVVPNPRAQSGPVTFAMGLLDMAAHRYAAATELLPVLGRHIPASGLLPVIGGKEGETIRPLDYTPDRTALPAAWSPRR
jgi:hypothetical protein